MATTPTTYYCQPSDVVRLFARNAVQIDQNTRFTANDLAVFIARGEDLIDVHLNRTWKPSVVIKNPDGSGVFCDLTFARYTYNLSDYLAYFKVPFGPILSIQKLEVFRGGQGYEDKTSDINNDNRPNGIWFNPNAVEVYVGRNVALPYNAKNAIRIQYTAGLGSSTNPSWPGTQTIPGDIKTAAEFIAASLLMQSEHWAQNIPGDFNSFQQLADKYMTIAYGMLEHRRGIALA